MDLMISKRPVLKFDFFFIYYLWNRTQVQIQSELMKKWNNKGHFFSFTLIEEYYHLKFLLD